MRLLVVGQKVTVRLSRWNENTQTYELTCSYQSAERSLEWKLSKTPVELTRFSRKVKGKMDGGVPLRRSWCSGPPTTEQVEVFLDSVFGKAAGGWLSAIDVEEGYLSAAIAEWRSDLASRRRSVHRSKPKPPNKFEEGDAIRAAAFDGVVGAPPGLADIDRGTDTAVASKEAEQARGIIKLDAVLSEFLQLSVASLKKELHFDGKYPEGYLHKAPIYYHDELWFMNVIVIMQFVLAAVSVLVAYYMWSFWPLVAGAGALVLVLLMHVYLSRPTEPGRTTVLPCCFIPGLGQVSILGYIVYDYLIRQNSKRWCVFRPGYIAYFESNYDNEPRGVFMLDKKNTHIRSPWWHFCNPFVLQIANNDQTLSLHAKSAQEMRRWRATIETTCALTAPNRLSLPKAFIRPRDMFGQRANVPAQWYADARFFYRDVYDAINKAQHEVFITGWMISPELQLVRSEDASDLPPGTDTSLENVLGQAVRRGVKVHVLLYRDVEMALPNNSRHAKERLVAQGVQIIRHAAFSRAVGSTNHIFCLGAGDVWWSHHEKIVAIDQALAFVGGVDLAFGRYDSHEHRLADPEAQTWPGKDFYNVRIKEFEHLEDPHTDLVDRKVRARMPWHDIHCSVSGNAARDVARHFVARWNRELRQGSSFQAMRKSDYRYLLPAAYEYSVLDEIKPLPYVASAAKLLRSIGPWSLSAALENSIKNKYLELITEAERFIYIENQFFNAPDIADAIADRLWQALDDGVEFRVIVVLPQWPAFEGMPFDNPQTKIVLRYQHITMDSIIKRVRSHPSVRTHADVAARIGFFSLRRAEVLAGKAVSEQVYVHSKLMIVDDERLIIGSANLNQRSLRGDRDSEVCIYMHAPELAHDLRCALFIEHLGLHSASCAGCRQCSLSRRDGASRLNSDAYAKVKDPFTPLWGEVARSNTTILEHMFPGEQPRNEYTTVKKAKRGFKAAAQANGAEDVQRRQKSKHNPVDPAEEEEEETDEAKEAAALAATAACVAQVEQLQGHLVATPLRFLRDEKRLLPRVTQITTYILPTATFT